MYLSLYLSLFLSFIFHEHNIAFGSGCFAGWLMTSQNRCSCLCICPCLCLSSFTSTRLFLLVVVFPVGASLNSGFLINCHCRGKMWPTSREQWDNEGGGEWMVGMGREQGRNSPQAQFSPLPTSPLWKYCHCSWKLYTHTTMIGLIPNHPVVPQVIGQSHLSSPINYCQYQPRCLGKLMYWLNAPRPNYKW